MTPKNEDIFADLNPEFYDSVVFPVSYFRFLISTFPVSSFQYFIFAFLVGYFRFLFPYFRWAISGDFSISGELFPVISVFPDISGYYSIFWELFLVF